jgi:CMP-N,N'-diacetyllegionaminic acid synthase
MPAADHPENGGVLGLVPARGGSKGIPNKNIRILAGLPLIGHSIAAARQSGVIERIVLTTDDPGIAEIGRGLGADVPFRRPPELAQDDTPMLPVLQHAVNAVMKSGWSPAIVVLLQPTAPFRRMSELQAAIALLQNSPEADSVVSVEAVPGHLSPYYVMKISGGLLTPFLADGARFTRRQDAPVAYSRNGQFYIVRRRVLLEGNSLYGTNCLPFVTKHEAVNLDTLSDWSAAEALAGKVRLPLA